MKRAAVIANDPVADEAASDFLFAGGSAVGAVLCGFFAAAGASAGVLLGPVSVLVAGVGTGARCFDGRMCQPGVGHKRPRGLTAKEAVPDAARVAVPASVAALLVAHAYDGSQRITTLMKPGITRAQRGGSEGRAALLGRVRAVGAGAFSEASFVRAMLRVAGPSQGGLITPGDFGNPSDIDCAGVERKVHGGSLVEAPWAGEGEAAHGSPELGAGFAVCAVDVRGVFAAVCYRRVLDGLVIDDLELDAPLLATPVKRGVTRVAPGARLPAPAPIAIFERTGGAGVELLAAPGAGRVDPESAPLRLVRDPSTLAVAVVRR